jgi:hypothetical protein
MKRIKICSEARKAPIALFKLENFTQIYRSTLATVTRKEAVTAPSYFSKRIINSGQDLFLKRIPSPANRITRFPLRLPGGGQ